MTILAFIELIQNSSTFGLAWIAALSVFVLLEKIIPRGFWVAKAAGLVLMGWGGWMALSGGA